MTSLLFEKSFTKCVCYHKKTYPEDAGFDLFAHFTTENTAMRLKPGQRVANRHWNKSQHPCWMLRSDFTTFLG